MAFNPLGKKNAQAADCEEELPVELQEKTVNPNYDAEKISDLRQHAKIQTLKALNALKIMQPIIIALMQRPGIDSEGKDLSEGFFHLIRETSNLAEETCKKIGVDISDEKNLWIRNVLEKTFAEFYKEEWIQEGTTNREFLEKIVELVIQNTEKIAADAVYEDISSNTMLKLSTIKSVLPWLTEAREFNLYRDIENDVEFVSEKLFSTTLKGVEMISDEHATAKDKLNIFNILSHQLGEIYALSWKSEASRIKDIVSTLEEDKLNKYLQKYPEGLPIDKVNVDFDRYFEKLLVVTDKLTNASKKPGTIENRMKNK